MAGQLDGNKRRAYRSRGGAASTGSRNLTTSSRRGRTGSVAPSVHVN